MGVRPFHMLTWAFGEGSGLDQIVVRVGMAASCLVAGIYLTVGLITGDPAAFVQSIGPLLAAVLMTTLILLEREDGGLALVGSGVIVAVWYTVFGDPATVVPAAVSLVVIASLGMLFVRANLPRVATLVGLVLAVVPQLWQSTQKEQLALGGIMAVSFLLTFLILHSIHGSVSTLNSRYQILFDESPTAVLEEDWSEAIEYVRSEYAGRPDRLRQFLLAYPEVVRQAVARVRTVRANEAALSLLEIDDPSSVPGYKAPKDVTEENLESHVGTLVALHQGVKTWDQDIPAVSRFGEPRWLQARSVDTSESTPASSIVIGLTDVTHIKARNEAMAELMRAKDQFIANVSHELRTPLTAVVGLTSELVAEQTMGQEERVELLKLVSSQASEMANIVEDLLVAARSQMGTVAVQLQEVDLVVELRSTIDGLGITLDVPERVPPKVMADPRRVRQILRNLLTNAIRYGGPHRRVVTGTLFDRVWLEVRDDGEGIPSDDAERIFEPYVTGNAGVQGSVGLGLAVARQLAELMEGSLRYARTGGESIFRLELPTAAIRESALASHHESG